MRVSGNGRPRACGLPISTLIGAGPAGVCTVPGPPRPGPPPPPLPPPDPPPPPLVLNPAIGVLTYSTFPLGNVLYVNTPIAGFSTSGGGGGSGGGSGGGGGPGRGGPGTVQTPAGPAPINVLIGNPQARGLPFPETRINYQDVS